ncbi:hypothetical protein PACTADRAFT_33662 [Pachysolen tannophilus NRRL Y-2460]|uniref:Aminopeptidase n=1 Tax=Pachysolen tannophilus NRRL Y-2460 TaxID=669874 RepID=A0A1E4TXM3_PACTA|nr:hypothetical protein PACTADRAFT_33662 [Pachysolen tannophilus NRRL Y-2460]
MTLSHEGLPRSLLPSHYDIKISEIDTESNIFNGFVSIDLTVEESTDNILLNIRDITIKTIGVYTAEKKPIHVKKFDADLKTELLSIDLEDKLAKGSKIYVSIKYAGIIQTNMSGFYRSDYKDEITGKEKCCLSTQFEATDARRGFPCLDEPNFKATFSIEVIVKQDWIALSNVELHQKEVIENQGLVKYIFNKTVVMSTYLVAWACGDFEYIESFTERLYNNKPIPVRVYTARGLKEQGQFGLNVATKSLDYFSKIFDLDYPLPKLDLISVPTYSHNGMENYGLITFRSTALLFDEKTSDTKYKQKIAYVVAHEVAHQWFGDLVTMDWWNELWLNEGFATWVGTLAVSYLYPEWEFFTSFISTSLQSALALDSLRGSHPIEVPVYSALDIDQVFDDISYLKGASAINMLSSSLGVDVFLRGVSLYLKKHKYGNAKTNDLWKGISESSNVDVTKLMDSWISKIGFPYLIVKKTDTGISVEQNRFLSTGDVKPEENETLWWVPLNISTGPNPEDVLKNNSDSWKFFSSRTIEIPLDTTKFFKLNKDSVGVYRVFYDSDILSIIIENIDKLSVKDKIGLLADTASIASAGLGKTSALLELIWSFKDETDINIWTTIICRLSKLAQTWFEQPLEVQVALKKFQQEIYSHALNNIGFKDEETDSLLTKNLRMEILSAAGLTSVHMVVEEAKRIFKNWEQGKEEIRPSARSFVLSTVLHEDASSNEFNVVLKEVLEPSSLDAREIALTSMGHLTSKNEQALLPKAVELLLKPFVPEMDVHFLSSSLARNNETRWLLWKFIKANYDDLYKKLSANMVIMDRFIKFSLTNFASNEAYDDIKDFFADKNIIGFERSLSQVLESIKANAKWVNNDADDVKDWLARNKYL